MSTLIKRYHNAQTKSAFLTSWFSSPWELPGRQIPLFRAHLPPFSPWPPLGLRPCPFGLFHHGILPPCAPCTWRVCVANYKDTKWGDLSNITTLLQFKFTYQTIGNIVNRGVHVRTLFCRTNGNSLEIRRDFHAVTILDLKTTRRATWVKDILQNLNNKLLLWNTRTFGFLLTLRKTSHSVSLIPLILDNGRSSLVLTYSSNAGVKSIFVPVIVIGISCCAFVEKREVRAAGRTNNGLVKADAAANARVKVAIDRRIMNKTSGRWCNKRCKMWLWCVMAIGSCHQRGSGSCFCCDFENASLDPNNRPYCKITACAIRAHS